jgi:hypothetical protein
MMAEYSMMPRYLPCQSAGAPGSGFSTGAALMLCSDKILTASRTEVSPGISVTAERISGITIYKH